MKDLINLWERDRFSLFKFLEDFLTEDDWEDIEDDFNDFLYNVVQKYEDEIKDLEQYGDEYEEDLEDLNSEMMSAEDSYNLRKSMFDYSYNLNEEKTKIEFKVSFYDFNRYDVFKYIIESNVKGIEKYLRNKGEK